MAIAPGLSILLPMLGLAGRILAATTAKSTTTSYANFPTPPPTHAPYPVASIPVLPSQFSDIPKKSLECWDSRIRYSFSSNFIYSQWTSAQTWYTTTFPTPVYDTFTYTYELQSCTIAYPGLTTLCDGYPRARDCIESCRTTGISTSYNVFTNTDTFIRVDPTWVTEVESYQSATPTCTPARDLSPECSRLAEAYTWRRDHQKNSSTSIDEFFMRPYCSVMIPLSTPPATPKCSMTASSYDAYYWPSPASSCNSKRNNTTTALRTPAPTAPPAVNPEKGGGGPSPPVPSPSVYQILHDVTVLTVAGHASLIGYGDEGPPVYAPSRTLRSLTLSQNPSSLLLQNQECHKPSPRGATLCTRSNVPKFHISDMFTVDASSYWGQFGSVEPTLTSYTICQASYQPTLALPLVDIVSQNHVAQDCEWTWEHSQRTKVVGNVSDVLSLTELRSGMFHAITATPKNEEGTGLPKPGSAGKTGASAAVPTS